MSRSQCNQRSFMSTFWCDLFHHLNANAQHHNPLTCQLLSIFLVKLINNGSLSSSLTAPPMFLPISSTPQPERRQPAQRRHSIEKETPTSVRQFLPPSRHSSKSLVSKKVTLTNSSFILCHFCSRPFSRFSVISYSSLTETNNATRFKQSYATLLSNDLIIWHLVIILGKKHGYFAFFKWNFLTAYANIQIKIEMFVLLHIAVYILEWVAYISILIWMSECCSGFNIPKFSCTPCFSLVLWLWRGRWAAVLL